MSSTSPMTPVDQADPTGILKGLELSLDQNRRSSRYRPYGDRPLAGDGTRILATRIDGDELSIILENDRVFVLKLTER